MTMAFAGLPGYFILQTSPIGVQALVEQVPPGSVGNGVFNVSTNPTGPQSIVSGQPPALGDAPVLLEPGFYVQVTSPFGSPQRLPQVPANPSTLPTGGLSNVLTDPTGPQSNRQEIG